MNQSIRWISLALAATARRQRASLLIAERHKNSIGHAVVTGPAPR
jgi:hypothetical protein